jgi:hypothetical protein
MPFKWKLTHNSRTLVTYASEQAPGFEIRGWARRSTTQSIRRQWEVSETILNVRQVHARNIARLDEAKRDVETIVAARKRPIGDPS